MIAVQGYQGRRVAVLGLGRSGLATGKALLAGGADALCWDDNEAARNVAEAAGLSVFDLNRAGAWDDVAALIVSPGIPHLYPKPNKLVARALEAGVPVDNDISLFFRSFATSEWDHLEVMPKVVAITGSNGKSTTSALIAHVLEHAGRDVQLAGNIGRGVLDIDPATNGSVAVLELSSYQTELARAMTPDIAVFTNLSPDHLDRHGGIGGYFAAKRRLFAEGGPDRAIIGVDEPEGAYLAGQLGEGAGDDRVIRISVTRKLAGLGWQIMIRKGHLAEWRKGRQVGSIDLRNIKSLPGVHNHQNACAAYAVCRTLGLAPKVVEAAFHTFKGLPHRSQLIAESGGVTYVNDSKATNVESAAAALQAFKSVRWIAGGQGKDGGISVLSPHLKHVAKAYLIGASAREFATQLGDTPYKVCENMECAVKCAMADAVDGDTVLLAPAAASFDQYKDFEARGDDFTQEILKRLKQ